MSRKVLRKIELMHEIFGRKEGRRCGECANLVRVFHGKMQQQCCPYGLSSSGASDWQQEWNACGLFNKLYTGDKIMKLASAEQRKEFLIPRQYSLEILEMLEKEG